MFYVNNGFLIGIVVGFGEIIFIFIYIRIFIYICYEIMLICNYKVYYNYVFLCKY